MDSIKGAIELRALLEKRGATSDDGFSSQPEVPASAFPLFHWLGVIPAAADEGVHPPSE